jgi:hypothetical protein
MEISINELVQDGFGRADKIHRDVCGDRGILQDI